MNRVPLLLFLAALAIGTSCTKKEEETVVGRGMIVNPRKAKPMLDKTRAATEAMSKSNKNTQAGLDKLK